MKKLIYGFLITFMLFIGISGVSATDGALECYYTEVEGGSKIKVIYNINGNIQVIPESQGESGKAINYCLNSSGMLISNDPTQTFNDCQAQIGGDSFIRNNEYTCPSSFYFGTRRANTTINRYFGFNYDNLCKAGETSLECTDYYQFSLSNTVNSIKDKEGNSKTPIHTCTYKIPPSKIGERYTINVFDDGYSVTFANANALSNITLKPTIDIPLGAYTNGCDNVTLYTDCGDIDFNNDQTEYTCTISIKEIEGSREGSIDKGILSGDDLAKGSIMDGTRLVYLMGQLKTPLMLIPNSSSALNYSIKINGSSTTLSQQSNGYDLCKESTCGGVENATYYIDKASKDIAAYCGTIYQLYADKRVEKIRIDECNDFNKLYQHMVKNNLVSDLSSDCPLLSNDMIAKLKWVLNIFRIVAPLLAFGLATIDFIKVIASGDADKEMKNAGKRLLYRIIAAILLLVIPTIIAFLLDVFLGNSDGYNSDNPFCSIVEWKE